MFQKLQKIELIYWSLLVKKLLVKYVGLVNLICD